MRRRAQPSLPNHAPPGAPPLSSPSFVDIRHGIQRATLASSSPTSADIRGPVPHQREAQPDPPLAPSSCLRRQIGSSATPRHQHYTASSRACSAHPATQQSTTVETAAVQSVFLVHPDDDPSSPTSPMSLRW
uniref:Uncharacterized protein n=1 Tax=Triticum urartu TaxID=4572 RepID=A0A8R7TFG7_TRIUA